MASDGQWPDGWRLHRLDAVCEGIYDCPHSTPTLTSEGPYIARSQDIRSGTFRPETAAKVSEQTYRGRVTRAEPRPGDLLYSREGTYFGIAAEVPHNLRVCLGQRMVLLRPDPEQINSRFLRYWLDSPLMAAHTQARRDGSVAERLNLPTIRALPVIVPPLQEQRGVACALGSFDDKIELNRRMSETLEATARALFKSWFVDFDPVRAKAEGRDPGAPERIADLFPDSFEDSELGEIPAGWTVRPFADTVEVIGGGTPKTAVTTYWNGEIPWFSVADAPTGSDVWAVGTEKRITQLGIEGSPARVLPVGTTIISARGTVGRLALVGVPMAMNQSCYGLRGKTGDRGYFTYFATRGLVSALQQHAHGSVFDTITRDTLAGVSAVVPPPGLVVAFEGLVGPTLERIRAGLLESHALTALRDALLPKLLSGQLKVSSAERMTDVSLDDAMTVAP